MRDGNNPSHSQKVTAYGGNNPTYVTVDVKVETEPTFQLEVQINGTHLSLALLDSGVTVDFIDNELANRLR